MQLQNHKNCTRECAILWVVTTDIIFITYNVADIYAKSKKCNKTICLMTIEVRKGMAFFFFWSVVLSSHKLPQKYNVG